MSEPEKKQQRIYDFLNTEPEPVFFVDCIQSKEKNFTKRELFKEKEEWSIKQKIKRRFFLIALTTAIKKDLIMFIRKHNNELKVYKKN